MNKYSRLLVTLQVLIAASLFLSARPRFDQPVQIVVFLLGVAWGAWAVHTVGSRRVRIMPDVDTQAVLVTKGPFRYVRHPMYSGLLVTCGALVACPFEIWKLVVLVILAIVLLQKSIVEERALCERFPEYQDYQRRTKRFIPFLV